MNLAKFLQQQAQYRGDAPALIDCTGMRPRIFTFAALETASARAATLLRRQGLQTGDSVLILHPMCADLYILLAAIFRLGAVAMFLDPSQGHAHVERCCKMLAPRAMFASPRGHLLGLASPVLRNIPLKFATGLGFPGAASWRLGGVPASSRLFDSSEESPALITFTSGSTGQPKAAVRTHGFLHRQHEVLSATLALTPEDIVLTTLPIFVLSHLAAGVCTLIPNVDIRHPGRVQPGPVVDLLATHRVTCIEASPAFLERVVRYCDGRRHVLPAIARVFTGGGPVFPHLLERTQRIAPNAAISAVYGSTEAEPIAHFTRSKLKPIDIQQMGQGGGLLAGEPVSAANVRILPDRWGAPIAPFDPASFTAVCLPAGQAGEIVVCGPHVLTGYLHGDGDQETKFCVGDVIWHRTGDAGYFDDAGRLWLLGRCAERVADKRGLLYSLAVEASARQIAPDLRCAFVAHQERRVFVVEQDASLTKEVQQRLCTHLAWSHIDEWRTVSRLPLDKRHNSKIDYPALHRILMRG
jgi:acyl-CoA synthetase (AMP-forming)/AMP-acid ligase II